MFASTPTCLREKALIVRNDRGGWSMILPSAGIPLGNYGSAPDAAKLAQINGYEPIIEEEAS